MLNKGIEGLIEGPVKSNMQQKLLEDSLRGNLPVLLNALIAFLTPPPPLLAMAEIQFNDRNELCEFLWDAHMLFDA